MHTGGLFLAAACLFMCVGDLVTTTKIQSLVSLSGLFLCYFSHHICPPAPTDSCIAPLVLRHHVQEQLEDAA